MIQNVTSTILRMLIPVKRPRIPPEIYQHERFNISSSLTESREFIEEGEPLAPHSHGDRVRGESEGDLGSVRQQLLALIDKSGTGTQVHELSRPQHELWRKWFIKEL